jgi:hypothetical protein
MKGVKKQLSIPLVVLLVAVVLIAFFVLPSMKLSKEGMDGLNVPNADLFTQLNIQNPYKIDTSPVITLPPDTSASQAIQQSVTLENTQRTTASNALTALKTAYTNLTNNGTSPNPSGSTYSLSAANYSAYVVALQAYNSAAALVSGPTKSNNQSPNSGHSLSFKLTHPHAPSRRWNPFSIFD